MIIDFAAIPRQSKILMISKLIYLINIFNNVFAVLFQYIHRPLISVCKKYVPPD